MIEVKQLSYTYHKQKEPTLKNVGFEIDKGEIFGFLGPSGAGKSTTLNILIGLLKEYEGRVRVFGKDLKDFGQAYYEKVGVSFELPNHFKKMTALENLRFFASLYAGPTQDPMRVLEMVHLHDDAHTRVAQYSKGMMMRLNIARSLIHNPELLFFDEPTSGLDPANAKRVKQLILQLKEQGKTVFLTTHNMQVVDEVCDRVAFIVDGSIALIASPRELKVKHGERTVAVVVREDQSLKKREFPLDCLGDNPDFIRLLKEAEVETIHTKEATLEDIFIQVTGRELV